ncbi:hypothetical protein PN498_11410 [Oscillatoria sp. CS-180]|uniref:hypothetical protein n=1 Tax=Oscillatoria sp. CS-180 TaxID=3021720 RepID=UPI00232F2F18|nr:hypothetical protein [Oscillatoria sp. CS-180]MDB9526600.1 hypothetical protein [Oscillatoria sp. CS-180]
MVFTLATLAGSVMRRITPRRSRFLLLFLIPTLLLSLLISRSAIAFPLTLFIDQARHQPDGAEVIINGVVTVPSGLFESANLDQGFAIQDPTGGIYVSSDYKLNELQVGDRVQVRGTLQDDGHNQRMVVMKDCQPSDRAFPAITPPKVTLETAGHKLDGKLVTVKGTITRPLQDDAPYGDRLWIADDTAAMQIYIPKSTHIDPHNLSFLQPGQAIQVTGLSSQFDENDEVIPRTRQDIILHHPP